MTERMELCQSFISTFTEAANNFNLPVSFEGRMAVVWGERWIIYVNRDTNQYEMVEK